MGLVAQSGRHVRRHEPASRRLPLETLEFREQVASSFANIPPVESSWIRRESNSEARSQHPEKHLTLAYATVTLLRGR
jgi:hypothetical protein